MPVTIQCLTHSGYSINIIECHTGELWRNKNRHSNQPGKPAGLTLQSQTDSSCFSSCSVKASSPSVNTGYTWPDASWIQMEQRRFGRMEQYSQASWECPRVSIIQLQEFLSTLLLLYLIGKGSGNFWLRKPGAQIGSDKYLAQSFFDSLLLFLAWFPSLPYPLKP